MSMSHISVACFPQCHMSNFRKSHVTLSNTNSASCVYLVSGGNSSFYYITITVGWRNTILRLRPHRLNIWIDTSVSDVDSHTGLDRNRHYKLSVRCLHHEYSADQWDLRENMDLEVCLHRGAPWVDYQVSLYTMHTTQLPFCDRTCIM